MKIKLMQIVAEFVDSADLSEHQVRRLYNIAVRGHRDFNMGVYGSFKSILLPVNDNKTCDLPCDFLSFSKLGILNDNGEVVCLKLNENLSPMHSQYVADQMKVADVPVASNVGPFPMGTFGFYWLNYVGYGLDRGYHLFGLAGGSPTVGEYRIDETAKTIFLNQDWPYAYVLLEYLSDGYDDDGEDFFVDVRASEAMIGWIRWKNAEDQRKKYSLSEILMYKRDYYNERRKAKLRLNSVNIQEMEVVYRNHIKLVARA
jgi:hypothetical protein